MRTLALVALALVACTAYVTVGPPDIDVSIGLDASGIVDAGQLFGDAEQLAPYLVVVGDSTSTVWPGELTALIAAPVKSEARAGWSYLRFTSAGSPFIAGDAGLDAGGYAAALATVPTHVVVLLGVNDCFSLPESTMGATIAATVARAGALVSELQRTWPGARVRVATPLDGSPDQAKWDASYPGSIYAERARWVDRTRPKFVSALRARFPDVLELAGVVGAAEWNDALHPNRAGAHAIALTIGAWVMP